MPEPPMMQYQSFPGMCGDSRSMDKLEALHLPVMRGRSFLDVGCNEGFFCGFAQFAGASRVVGLDQSAEFIRRARGRFPDCKFHCLDWECLPDGPFDVILLASALHYADDQPALLHRLVDHLSRDGVLVLELGLARSKKAEWVKIRRGNDERWYPSLMQLRNILAPYASKWIGPSVPQTGDPVPRHVVHVSRRRPIAYLLMQPSGYGKTSVVGKLFVPAGISVVSGDLQLTRVARGKVDASAVLRELAAKDFSPYTMDQSVERVFARRLGRELVTTWLAAAGDGDFAFDGYVPAKYHHEVRQYLVDAGYLPILFDWERPGPTWLAGRSFSRTAHRFYRALRKKRAPRTGDPGAVRAAAIAEGYVDRIRIDSGRLVIAGWARNADGELPVVLEVRLPGRVTVCRDFEVVSRPDVGRHLHAADDRLGFRISLDAGGASSPADLSPEFSVAPPGGHALQLTSRILKLLHG